MPAKRRAPSKSKGRTRSRTGRTTAARARANKGLKGGSSTGRRKRRK